MIQEIYLSFLWKNQELMVIGMHNHFSYDDSLTDGVLYPEKFWISIVQKFVNCSRRLNMYEHCSNAALGN